MYKYFFLLLSLLSCSTIKKNQVVVLNGSDNTLQVIDLKSFSNKRTIPISTDAGYFAHHLYLSPSKKYLTAAFPKYDFSQRHDGLHNNGKPGKAVLISRKNPLKQVWFEVPNANFNAVLNRSETELWTAVYNHTGKIYVYDVKTQTLKQTINVESDPSELTFSQDGKYLAVACGESSFITIIDTKTYKKIKDIKVDPNPANIWPGYAQFLFVENELRKSLNIIDLDKMKVADYIDFGFVPGFIAYNKTQNEIWTSSPADSKMVIYTKNDKGKWVKKTDFITKWPVYTFRFTDSSVLCLSREGNEFFEIDMQNHEILKSVSVGKKPNSFVIFD